MDPKNLTSFRFYESEFFLWVLFFLYILFIGVSIQLIVLPLIFPQFHWGEGLLLGTDSITYHQIASGQADIIRKTGWQNWILSPLGQTPAGIASLFYAIFTSKPWVMLPLQAAFYAGSALLIFKILSFFALKTSRWVKVAAVIPFLVFPSAAIIYAQLLKDCYFIFGNLLFIYIWLQWLKKRNMREMVFLRQYIFYLFLLLLAYLMVWIIRPYWGTIFFLWSLVFFMIITVNQIGLFFIDKRLWKKRGTYLILSLILVLIFGVAIQQKILPRSMRTENPGNEQLRVELSWSPSKWLPSFLDSQLKSLAVSRKAFVLKYPKAGTNIDTDILFQNAKDMIFYLPRAFYIGFFMPTPDMTFQKGITPRGTLMHRVAGFEMIFLYFCYPFLIIACWSWKKKLEFWLLLLWATGGILVYTLVSPNIGALYRFRYGFIMALTSLGIFKAVMLLPKLKEVAD